jgi:hypothetical protein
MSWKLTFDGVFFISIATIIAGSFGLAVKHCLKSKCENFSICWGLLNIRRRVDLEVQEELAQMELGQLNNDEVKIEEPKGRLSPKLSFGNFQSKYIPYKKDIIKEKNLEEKTDI